jgi:hypothetical protein
MRHLDVPLEPTKDMMIAKIGVVFSFVVTLRVEASVARMSDATSGISTVP